MPTIITLHHSPNTDAIRAILTIDVSLSGLEELQSTMTREQLLAEMLIKEVADAIQPGWIEGKEPHQGPAGRVHEAEGGH